MPRKSWGTLWIDSGQGGGYLMIDTKELDTRFTYHPPKDEAQLRLYEELREKARQLASFMARTTPASREQSLAITKLEEAVMWANAAIARRS